MRFSLRLGAGDTSYEKAHFENKNISNVIRVDLKNDLLSNPKDVFEYLAGTKQNSSDDGPHFDLARPGKETNRLIQVVSDFRCFTSH